MAERIVITGMGAISPLGLNVAESWQSAVNGVSGVGPTTLFDASDFLVQIACEVKGFQPENYLPAKEVRRRDRYQQFAAAAVQEAMQQSSLEITEANAGRIGVIISSAIGGISSMQEAILTVHNEGPRRVSPFVIPMLMSNASGVAGIGIAWMLLRAGVIDAALAGAAEATISEVGVACFDRLGAMSRRNQDFSCTPQPFDLNRDGLVMGEGAAVLVLERESHARQRGALILAELAGYAATADAFHITAPSEDGAGGAQAMRLALSAAGVNREDVDYINAHGTATPLNDLSETLAIKATFGELAYNIPVSSTKSMTGHIMGATGALETVFCVQAVREGLLPPTIHYQTPDPKCDLDVVPNHARQKKVRVAMNNAFGFGGHNAVLVVREFSKG
jgi:3-oxoacyl-[acyl-carrier-protein] synthase II